MVSSVVLHGKCSTEKIIVFRAVSHVQPFAARIRPKDASPVVSVSAVDDEYAMRRMGRTISFAGRPRMKAVRMNPSSPITRAAGCSVWAVDVRMLAPAGVVMLARAHTTAPAGAATINARRSTRSVRS